MSTVGERAFPAASTRGERGATSSARPVDGEVVSLRSMLAVPLVAVVTIAFALVATNKAGVDFGDPDHVGARRLAMVWGFAAALVLVDILVRAGRRTGRFTPSLSTLRDVRRERWTRHRSLAVTGALVGFYGTYVAYRNLKSVVPLLTDKLYDEELAHVDRIVFGAGMDPAEILHTVLGTGISTQVLSSVYVSFVFLLPLSLAFALVFAPNLRGGLFFATALAINWGLGAVSYLLLPARGPIYYVPGDFATLPDSHASYLQGLLLDERREFLADPNAVGAAQNIAAFASLHCSLLITAALAAHLLGLARWLRIALWVLFVVSAIATVHLGWHYVIDDVAGVAIALIALGIACFLTGFDGSRARD
ncbi:MAG: hypothetical protein QOI64_713 [Solirubrobacteraceae bacterium]|nr:hypothetical protein [Solirubrobacteraceae bacterium]